MHGKTSRDPSRGTGLFTGLPSPFRATRYHSLVIAPASVPAELEILATSEDGEIMAVQHVRHPVYGVQFHPESVLTEHGYRLVDHFLHGVPATPRAAAARRRRRAGGRRARAAARSASEPAAGGSRPVIIETIVTTMEPAGTINFAPMGVEWGEETIVLKPFLETTTYRNVRATGVAVVNLTDDAMLFAQGAISSPQFPWVPRPWSAARCWRRPARGGNSRSSRSTTRPRAPVSRRVWSTGGSAASFSASTARGTPCSRPRSSRPAPICSRPRRFGRSTPGCR